jgi:hypothetical protein
MASSLGVSVRAWLGDGMSASVWEKYGGGHDDEVGLRGRFGEASEGGESEGRQQREREGGFHGGRREA